jgi:hypothetical protein
VNSGSATVRGTAGFTNLAIGGPVSTAMTPMAPAHACPSTWTCADIGNPAPVGDTTRASNGTFTLSGTGSGFVRGYLPTTNADSFHYVYRSGTGNHAISARVTTPTTASTAEFGVMMRASTAPTAPVYCAYLTPGGSVTVNWRRYDAVLNRYAHTVSTVSSPAYLKIVRTAKASPPSTVFTAFTSTNGTTWTAVPGSSVAIDMGSGPYLLGLAATSASTSATTPATFAAVKVS